MTPRSRTPGPLLAGLVGAVLATACEPATGELVDDRVRSAVVRSNGTNLNGTNLNGTNLNGPDSALAAARFDPIEVGGVTLDAAWLDGSMLRGTAGGRSFTGTALTEAELDGVLVNGTAMRLKLAQVVAPGWGSDVWRYQVLYRTAAHTWEPVCADGRLAVAVNGVWRYDFGQPGAGGKVESPGSFTFGCEGAAIAKCVFMGYRPWATTAGGRSLEAHHEACVRMVRGDYCGNGVSQTTDGRLINVYDGVGVQADTEPWLFEAEWDAQGARCISPLNRSLLGLLCADALIDLGCGSAGRFSTGTLLMTETPTGPVGGLF